MSEFQTVIYRRFNSVARITLNRQPVLNAFSVQMRDDLWEVLHAIRADSEISIILIDGAGKAFCAGADLTEFLTAPSPIIARDVRLQRDLWRFFLGMRQPIVAALHGYVIGSGLEIALNCDLRLCAEGTLFRLPETSYGFIPGAGGTQLLPRAGGKSLAIRHILTGEWFNADAAYHSGLVNRLIPPTLLEKESIRFCESISRLPTRTIMTLKSAIRRGSNLPLHQALQLEKRLSRHTQLPTRPPDVTL